jgi:5'-deoxynucleotidase YfbR-like HD superfamily hydrolase
VIFDMVLSLSACCCLAAQEIRELWMEYEENASLEAKVVKDFDKVQFHISIHQVGGMIATSV